MQIILRQAMNGENRLLYADEVVEFKKELVEVQDFRKIITDDFWGIYWIYLESNKEILQDRNM